MKYKVEFREVFNGDMWEFDVEEDDPGNTRFKRKTGVWYNPETQRANCFRCSGPLSAMLSTCPHAKAVVRFVKKTGFTPPDHKE